MTALKARKKEVPQSVFEIQASLLSRNCVGEVEIDELMSFLLLTVHRTLVIFVYIVIEV